MATQYIKFKRSSVPGKRPSISQMDLGELALNTYDGRLFARKDNVGIGSTVTLLNVWTENIGGGAYYNDGSIGIGTTNPQAALEVVSTIPGGGIRVSSTGTNSPGFRLINNDYPNYFAQNLLVLANGHGLTNSLSGDYIIRNNAGGSIIFGISTTSGATSTTGFIRITPNSELLVGTSSSTSTGTPSQNLQVTGGAYVSGNLGIGTTNPTSRLHISGDTLVTGVVTATTFVGALTGTASSATQLLNPRIFEITGDIVASPVSFNGTGNVSLAATIQPNSVGLGTDTTGDYVRDITGTANQITVTGGTGEGSAPVLSIPNQFTVPQDITVTRDLQVSRNLNVDGNITIGGTSSSLITAELKIFDSDIVLGFRTDGSGNDISNDNTANHGGIAIASTEGTPLVNLFIAGIETNPSTYKKIMWFKSGAFAGLGTDAWLSNYAVGIGSTQVPNGVRLAAGAIHVLDNKLDVRGDIDFSGTFYQNGSPFVASRWSAGTENNIYRLNGNVGIGTTNPTSQLHVIGNGLFSGVVTATTFIGALSGTATSTTNIPNLSGDVSSNNTVTTLATVNSNVGTFGDAGAIPRVTVNGKGLVTGVTTVAPNNGSLSLAVSGTGLSGSASFTANQAGASTFTVTSNATSDNTNSTIVARNGAGGFSAGIVTASTFSGNLQNTLTLNTSGTGLSGSTTFNNSGASTFTVTSNATSDNTNSTIVSRNGSGGFVAGIVTATFVGNVTGNLNSTGVNTATTLSGTSLTYTNGTITNLNGTNVSYSGIGTVGSLNIGATQVISSGRQLQNIASLDATTTATIETAIANAPNTFNDLNVTGFTTLTRASATSLVVSGVTTSTDGFVGNITGNLNSTGVNTATNISGTTLSYTNGSVSNLNVSGVTTTGILNVGVGGTIITTNNNGFVGIGTTNPQYDLDINGDINFNGTFYQNGSQFVASRWNSGSGTDIYRLSNVGIGTTNPTKSLEVYTNDGNIRIGDITEGTSSTDAGVIFSGLGTVTSAIFTEVDGQILSYGINVAQITGIQTERSGGIFRLDTRTTGGTSDSNCFVIKGRSIGTTIEHNSIVINLNDGNTFLSPSKGSAIVGTSVSTNTPNQKLQVLGGAYVSGNIGIGTTNPTSKLHVIGDTLVTGITTLNSFLNVNIDTIPLFYSSYDYSRVPQGQIIVGIGTTNPVYSGITTEQKILLSFFDTAVSVGYTGVYSTLGVDGGRAFDIGKGDLSKDTPKYLDFGGYSNDIGLYPDYHTRIIRNGTDNGSLQILNRGTGDVSISAGQTAGELGNFDIFTASTRRLRVSSTGNIGLNVLNPTSRLHVSGDVLVTGVVTATTFSGALSGTATSTTNIPNLSGDVSSVNTVTTLATVNSNVGTFGDAGSIPRVTVNGKGLVTGVTTVAPNNGSLSLAVSGTGLSGSATFTANQAGASTFTVTSNATSDNTNSTIVSRNGSGGFVAGIVTASTFSGNLQNTLTLNTSGTGLSGSTTFNNSGASTFTVTSNATSANTNSTIVSRDGSGNFSAGTITANLSGNATGLSGTPNITVGVITATDLTLSGNLTVNGTTTTLNTETLQVEDKNIELGLVTSPTNTTADGGGITLKGTTDKTFNWINATSSWTSSENLNLLTGKTYKINGTDVLSSTTLGSGVVNSSLTSVGTLTKLDVGNVNSTGIVTATSFVGALSGTATSTTNIPNLSGDVSSVNTVTTLATVNSNVGTFGDAGAIPRVTVNGKGLVTGVTTVAPNNGALTLNVSGTGLSGSASFTANQAGASTFTVTSNATSDNTNSAIVARNSAGGFVAGIVTATFVGNITGNLNSTGVNTATTISGTTLSYTNGSITNLSGTNVSYSGIGTVGSLNIGATQVISSGRQLQNIASLDATTTATIETAIANAPNTFTDLQVTGVSTFTNGPVFIGSGTSTGTATQRLQVTGGAYVSGNLGIGTTNPTSKLHVLGDVSIASTVSIGTAIDIIPYDNLNNGTLSFEGSAGQLFSITNNLTSGSIFSVNDVSGIPSIDVDANGTVQIATFGGNLGVGTTNPTSKLHVIGDVLVSGIITSTDYNSASDIKLKENIQPISNPIDKVMNITGVSFDWKETGRSSMGVIAQEIEKVMPELVNGEETKTVNYNGLIGLLIEVVKHQQEEINELKRLIK
jgi:hypothetical protein